MNKKGISGRILGICLCLLIAANALVWSGAYQNLHSSNHADELTDNFEEQIVTMDDINRRTIGTHLLTMDAFLDTVLPLFEKENFPEGIVAMVSFDGDGMGKKNEIYGTAATDRLVKAFAKVVKQHFPDSSVNIVSNVGEQSDEFYMLLLGRESIEALIAEIESFQEDLRAVRVKTDDGQELGGTVSIGIAVREEGQSFDSLFEEADQAAYEAKEAGKDCYHVSD